jgi:hypothetical protein
MLMGLMVLVLEQVMGHPPNMCRDSVHWVLCHQCECRLDAHTHLQDNDEIHPRTQLALEQLREQHQAEVPVLEAPEDRRCTHKGKLNWLQCHPLCYRRPWGVLAQGLALGPKEMEPELVGMANHVLRALLSVLRLKYQPKEGFLVPMMCGKRLQGQERGP